MQTRFGVVVLFTVLTLTGCQSPPGAANFSAGGSESPPETTGGLSPQVASQGRQLYLTKCARCHKFYDPSLYPDTEWQSWMHKMSRKAKLDPAQAELLTKYLDTFRERRGQ